MICSSVFNVDTPVPFQTLNLAGYGNLPKGFACAFVGGWLFAFLTMLSMFYACAIALNTQLVFVHRRTVKKNHQILFLVVPFIVALLISMSFLLLFLWLLIFWTRHLALPPLIAGVFGFDEVFDYCWMNTRGLSEKVVLIRVLFASDLWLCLSFGYLSFAVLLICYTLFSSRSPITGLGGQFKRCEDRASPRLRTHGPTDAFTSLAATLAWRDIARRALTIRVLGYIIVPVISIIPGVILDILGRTSHTPAPKVVLVITSTISGLMGTFNATLFCIDPSVLAVTYSPCARRQSFIHSTVHQSPRARGLNDSRDKMEHDQLGATTAVPLQGVLVTTVRLTTTDDDSGMDYEGHFSVPNPLPSSQCSTLGYDADELADAYNGL